MIIVVLTGVNLIGIHLSSGIQSVLTLFEVAGLVVIIAVGFGFIGSPLPSVEHAPAFSNTPSIGLLGLALVFVLLTFGGWNESAYISAEVKGGSKAIVSVIVLSIILITIIYLLVNWALIAGLGMEKLSSSKAAPADLLAMAFGPLGEKLLGLFVAVAALTSINATMIVGARTNYAFGDDWDSLRFMGRWESERGSPTLALLVQSAICLALVGFGAFQADGFDAMVEFTAPVFWFFLFLIGIAVFILRIKDRGVKRDFSIPLYPITPLLFCVSCAYLSYSSFAYAHSKGAVYISIYVMLLGIVALIFLRAKSARQLSK